MSDQDDVTRAVGVINTAIRHGLFPLGVMPESDADKLVEAEKLVVLCRQTKKVGDAIGPTKVQNYQEIMDVLAEADVFVGVNGDGTAQPQEAQPSSPQQQSSSSPQAQPATTTSQAPASSAAVTQEQSAMPPSASSVSSSPSSSPTQQASVTEQAPPAAPHPVDPDGLLAEPRMNEVWEGSGGGRWLVTADKGAMVEVLSQTDYTQTVVPKGFLKHKSTEAFVQVAVDDGWNINDHSGYNKLWYVHPGCVKWYVPLDDVPLPLVGSTVQCVTCDLVLPVVTVDPKNYVSMPVGSQPPPEAMINPEEAQGGGPVVPTTQPKLNEIHLTAYPDRGVKVFEHPGCSSWESPLIGKDGTNTPLMPVGVSGPCPRCGDQNVPLTRVEANGYDPATYVPVAHESHPVYSSAQQAVVDSGTLQPVQQVQQPPAQEAQPSAPHPQQSSPQSPPASPAAPPTQPLSAPPATSTPAPSSTVPPSAPAAPSSPSPSTERSTGAPVEHDEGDAEYRRILDQADADFLPLGMPAPQDLESPPPSMPEDLTQNPEANRELHSKFNALAARARYLAKIEERIARDCKLVLHLRLRPHLKKAKTELGASSTLTERREWAEETGGDDVKLWLDRHRRHADRAEAYAEFFHIYSNNVAVLSRDLSWAQNEERGS